MRATDSEITEAFKLLGIPLNSANEVITKSYRKLTIKYHPDKNPGDNKTSEKFRALKDAYELLMNPINRISSSPKEDRKQKQHAYSENSADDMENKQFTFFHRNYNTTTVSYYYSIDVTCTYTFYPLSNKKQSNTYSTCFSYEELKNIGLDIENKIKLKTKNFCFGIQPGILIKVTGAVHNANIKTEFKSLLDFLIFIEKFCPDHVEKLSRSFN